MKPSTLMELREERSALAAEVKNLVDNHKGANWGNQQQKAYNQAVGRITEIDAELERIQSGLDQDAARAFGKPRASDWIDANGNPVCVYAHNEQLSQPNGERDRAHIGTIMRAMAGSGGRRSEAVQAALQEGSDSAGGVTVPDIVTRDFIDAMRSKSVINRAGARTVELTSEKTTVARIVSDPTPGWRSELGAVASSEPTFDAVEFQARSLAVKLPVALELLQDSLNIEDALRTSLAGAFADEMDRVALFGSGTAPEPEGIINVTGVGSVDVGTNGAALTGYGPLVDAFRTIALANGPMPTAVVMSPRERYTLAGLTDTTGQPLNAPKPVADVPFMDTSHVPIDETHGSATDASRIIAGDFTQVLLGVRNGLRIELLRHTLADDLTITFVAHLRMDIALVHPAAFAQVEGLIPA